MPPTSASCPIGCATPARSTTATCVIGRGRARAAGLLARHSPRRDRRRDRQLSPEGVHPDRGQQRAEQRHLRRRDQRSASSGSCTCPPRWCSRTPQVFPTTEEYLPDCPTPYSAYGFSKLAGEVYCRAANEQFGLPYTICRPGNAYGPGEVPADEAGITHVIPDLIGKVALRYSGRCRSSARAIRRARSPTSTTPPTGSSPRCPRPPACTRTSTSQAPRRSRSRELAEIVWEACGNDPDEFELEPLEQPYKTDVQRRILSGRRPSACSAGSRRSRCATGSG